MTQPERVRKRYEEKCKEAKRLALELQQAYAENIKLREKIDYMETEMIETNERVDCLSLESEQH